MTLEALVRKSKLRSFWVQHKCWKPLVPEMALLILIAVGAQGESVAVAGAVYSGTRIVVSRDMPLLFEGWSGDGWYFYGGELVQRLGSNPSMARDTSETRGTRYAK